MKTGHSDVDNLSILDRKVNYRPSEILIKGFMLILTVFLLVNTMPARSQEVTRVMDRISTFIAAAEGGDTAKVAGILKQGIEVNVADEHGQTALMLAADQGHVDTVKLLLQHETLPNLQNKVGGTALMMASFNGHLDVVNELLKAGADANTKTETGDTALMVAAVKQNMSAVQIINLLLDRKADINAQDNEGYTALMRAIDRPPPPPGPISRRAKDLMKDDKIQREAEIQFMIVKTLMMRGADLGLRDQRGRTALEISRMNRQTRILEFLKSR